MATDFYIKQGDTLPAITATLTDAAGNPLNLTGATVTFRMRRLNQVLGGAATVTNATGGQVSYTWSTGDTSEANDYAAEWHVAFNDGTSLTVPNNGYLTVHVADHL